MSIERAIKLYWSKAYLGTLGTVVKTSLGVDVHNHMLASELNRIEQFAAQGAVILARLLR